MENELVDLVMEDTRERMDARDRAREERVRRPCARAGPARRLVEGLLVDYYGTETPLKQFANFSVPEPRLLVVSPFDKGSIRRDRKGDQQRQPRPHALE